MPTGISEVGFYYVNGVANTDESGSEVADEIQKIVKGSSHFDKDRVFTTFHLNDATPTERIAGQLIAGFGGFFAGIYSLYQEAKDQGNTTSRAIGGMGAVSSGCALYDFLEMQKDKDKVAKKLAAKVSKFLGDNENVANLILHSQGADIGYRSLELLEEKYRKRTRVVTLGAMTTIPKGLCPHVTNYKFTNDWVSRVLAIPFEKNRELRDSMNLSR